MSCGRAGTCPQSLKGSKFLTPVAGTEPPLVAADGFACGEAYRSPFTGRGDKPSSLWQECRTTKKALRSGRRAELHRASKWRVAGFGAALGRRRNRGRFRLRPAEPTDGTGANAPKDRDLRGLSLLGLAAILALILRAHDCPSTRTWSPLCRVSAMDSPRRLNATTWCHSVLACHSSFESFHDCCVATDSTVKFAPLPRTCRFSGSLPRKPMSWT